MIAVAVIAASVCFPSATVRVFDGAVAQRAASITGRLEDALLPTAWAPATKTPAMGKERPRRAGAAQR